MPPMAPHSSELFQASSSASFSFSFSSSEGSCFCCPSYSAFSIASCMASAFDCFCGSADDVFFFDNVLNRTEDDARSDALFFSSTNYAASPPPPSLYISTTLLYRGTRTWLPLLSSMPFFSTVSASASLFVATYTVAMLITAFSYLLNQEKHELLRRSDRVGLLRHRFRAIEVLVVISRSDRYVQVHEARRHVAQTRHEDNQSLGISTTHRIDIATVLLLRNVADDVDRVLVQKKSLVEDLALIQRITELRVTKHS